MAHRGRSGDPLYGIHSLLRAGAERLTEKQWTRLERAIGTDDAHLEVWLAWSCSQRLRSAHRHHNVVDGSKFAEKIIATSPTCPIPETKRLGRTLKQWRDAFLAYFTTGRSINGGTEADQRTDRTPPPSRPRLPQPRQLPVYACS